MRVGRTRSEAGLVRGLCYEARSADTGAFEE
jgi:hypothetical protein